jgi:hypothetical protein
VPEARGDGCPRRHDGTCLRRRHLEEEVAAAVDLGEARSERVCGHVGRGTGTPLGVKSLISAPTGQQKLP